VRNWRSKVWRAKELLWLKQYEGTYTVQEVMDRFNCKRYTAYYILSKHKLEFINLSAKNGFKKGNRNGKNQLVTSE
jgi:hypothetical protein